MDFDALLQSVAAELREAGIPVSSETEQQVRVNRRAKKRYGSCIRKGKSFVIELSAYLENAEEKIVRTVLAHELLHTCPGCLNHGARWKAYAAQARTRCGYETARTASYGVLPKTEPKPVKYLLQCQSCGALIPRQRMSRLVRAPWRYRCKCGGKLKRIE